jgi:hypothetical protein
VYFCIWQGIALSFKELLLGWIGCDQHFDTMFEEFGCS